MKSYKLKIGNQEYAVDVLEVKESRARVAVGGTEYELEIMKEENSGAVVTKPVQSAGLPARASLAENVKPAGGSREKTVCSPLPGIVIEVSVAVGQEVKAGSKLAVLEAMKMENEIQAEEDGIVKAICVKPGDSVPEGAAVIILG